MRLLYEIVGRIVVGRSVARWAPRLRIAAAAAVVAAGIAAYLAASRDVDEG